MKIFCIDFIEDYSSQVSTSGAIAYDHLQFFVQLSSSRLAIRRRRSA